MEPVSVLTGVIPVAWSCILTLRDVKDTLAKTQEVPQTLSCLERQIELLFHVLTRLEEISRTGHRASTLHSKIILTTLQGCHGTLEQLHVQLQKLKPLSGNKVGRWAKNIAAFWKEGEISRMMDSVAHEQRQIQLLMGFMSLDLTYTTSQFDSPYSSQFIPTRRNDEPWPLQHRRQAELPVQIYEDGAQPAPRYTTQKLAPSPVNSQRPTLGEITHDVKQRFNSANSRFKESDKESVEATQNFPEFEIFRDSCPSGTSRFPS